MFVIVIEGVCLFRNEWILSRNKDFQGKCFSGHNYWIFAYHLQKLDHKMVGMVILCSTRQGGDALRPVNPIADTNAPPGLYILQCMWKRKSLVLPTIANKVVILCNSRYQGLLHHVVTFIATGHKTHHDFKDILNPVILVIDHKYSYYLTCIHSIQCFKVQTLN